MLPAYDMGDQPGFRSILAERETDEPPGDKNARQEEERCRWRTLWDRLHRAKMRLPQPPSEGPDEGRERGHPDE